MSKFISGKVKSAARDFNHPKNRMECGFIKGSCDITPKFVNPQIIVICDGNCKKICARSATSINWSACSSTCIEKWCRTSRLRYILLAPYPPHTQFSQNSLRTLTLHNEFCLQVFCGGCMCTKMFHNRFLNPY